MPNNIEDLRNSGKNNLKRVPLNFKGSDTGAARRMKNTSYKFKHADIMQYVHKSNGGL